MDEMEIWYPGRRELGEKGRRNVQIRLSSAVNDKSRDARIEMNANVT
jgi:hypothetical protein